MTETIKQAGHFFIIDSTVVKVNDIHLWFSKLNPDFSKGETMTRVQCVILQDESSILDLVDERKKYIFVLRDLLLINEHRIILVELLKSLSLKLCLENLFELKILHHIHGFIGNLLSYCSAWFFTAFNC